MGEREGRQAQVCLRLAASRRKPEEVRDRPIRMTRLSDPFDALKDEPQLEGTPGRFDRRQGVQSASFAQDGDRATTLKRHCPVGEPEGLEHKLVVDEELET